MADPKYYVATTSGGVEIKGQYYPFLPGDLVEEGHPLLKHFAESDTFKPMELAVKYPVKAKAEPAVESATKAPGEKRTTRKA